MLSEDELKPLLRTVAARGADGAAAFERLYRRAAPVLLGIALRITRRRELADEVLHELTIPYEKQMLTQSSGSRSATPAGARPLDNDHKILLDALGFAPASIDSLVARTGFAADAVASMLLILELDGRVAQQPGGLFCRRLAGK